MGGDTSLYQRVSSEFFVDFCCCQLSGGLNSDPEKVFYTIPFTRVPLRSSRLCRGSSSVWELDGRGHCVAP